MLRPKIWCRHFYLPYQKVINNKIPYKADKGSWRQPLGQEEKAGRIMAAAQWLTCSSCHSQQG